MRFSSARKGRRGLLPRQRHALGLSMGSLASAALAVSVVVSDPLASASSPSPSAQVRKKIAAASALSSTAATIRIDQVTTTSEAAPIHYHRVSVPGSKVNETSYYVPSLAVYVTEIDSATTGYVRVTFSKTVPLARSGWFSYPLR